MYYDWFIHAIGSFEMISRIAIPGMEVASLANLSTCPLHILGTIFIYDTESMHSHSCAQLWVSRLNDRNFWSFQQMTQYHVQVIICIGTQ